MSQPLHTALAALAMLLLLAPRADACQPPMPGFTLRALTPAPDTAGVPIGLPILARFQSETGEIDRETLLAFPATLVDEAGEEVPGALELIEGLPPEPFAGMARFRPSAPLKPNSTYTFSITFADAWEGQTERTHQTTFTTGEASFEPRPTTLTEFTLKATERDVLGGCPDGDQAGFCGEVGCFEPEVIGTVDAFEAQVRVEVEPADTLLRVRVGLGASAGEAEQVRARAAGHLRRPEQLPWTLGAGHGEAPSWGATTACVSVEALDVDGRAWLDETVCDAIPGWTLETGPDPEPPAAATDGGGCSAAPGAPNALLALLLLLGLGRRRPW